MNLGRRWVLQQQANRAISLIIEELAQLAERATLLAERARLLAAASVAEAAKVAACVVQPFL
jgi:hypothetical protein